MRPGTRPRAERKGLAWLKEHVSYQGDDCLLWPFSRDGRTGRALLWHDGRSQWANRVMCEMVHGKPPTPKHQAAHECGKGHLGCLNPRHLLWKTSSENQSDRRRHGTQAGAKGTRTRLTAAQIAEIRKRKKTILETARGLGVSLGCVQYWLSHDRPPLPPGTSKTAKAEQKRKSAATQ